MSAPAAGRAKAPARGWTGLWLRVLLCVALGLAIVLVPAFFFFVGSLERHEPDLSKLAQADGIIVLTGGADRIEDGLRLLERGRGRRLFISGVNVQLSKEAFRKHWPAYTQLIDCCVDLGFLAFNTFQNAKESAEWLGRNQFKSLLLVTASYHMPRALLEFEAAMPAIATIPVPVVPEASRINRWWQDPALFKIMALEFVKYGAAILRVSLGLRGG